MDKQKYKPVKHTREKTARLLTADPDLKKPTKRSMMNSPHSMRC